MQNVLDVFLVLHILCWTVIIGGWLTRVKDGRPVPGALHAALGAIVTGLIMVGIAQSSSSVPDPNNAKISIKLVIAVVVAVLAFRTYKDGDESDPNLTRAMGGLAVVNVAIAVLWT